MVAEDGTQSGRRQRFATVWTFGHDEHLTRISFRSFRKQIALNQTSDLRIQRNPLHPLGHTPTLDGGTQHVLAGARVLNGHPTRVQDQP